MLVLVGSWPRKILDIQREGLGNSGASLLRKAVYNLRGQRCLPFCFQISMHNWLMYRFFTRKTAEMFLAKILHAKYNINGRSLAKLVTTFYHPRYIIQSNPIQWRSRCENMINFGSVFWPIWNQLDACRYWSKICKLASRNSAYLNFQLSCASSWVNVCFVNCRCSTALRQSYIVYLSS